MQANHCYINMDYTIDDSVQFYGVIKNVRHVLKLIKTLDIKNVIFSVENTKENALINYY